MAILQCWQPLSCPVGYSIDSALRKEACFLEQLACLKLLLLLIYIERGNILCRIYKW